MVNVEIVDDYCGILAINAECVISFWTAAILVSLLLNIPSIEYYIEAEKFRTHTEYHNGSYHSDPQFDIECTDKQNELENFLNKVKIGSKFNFEKFESNFKQKNLNCF